MSRRAVSDQVPVAFSSPRASTFAKRKQTVESKNGCESNRSRCGKRSRLSSVRPSTYGSRCRMARCSSETARVDSERWVGMAPAPCCVTTVVTVASNVIPMATPRFGEWLRDGSPGW
eukprot:838715-Prymnesium_polylepis.1